MKREGRGGGGSNKRCRRREVKVEGRQEVWMIGR